ncbi:unnamed protein product [Eruca vesicaria subsp. sativa]|uniref:TAFII28-like protein domain-containing protein n=1 Tax=Eruca vesicaria subsp. sativa TaxID=29727 RepID=A0ABC8JHZ5_ERUVS|nr:unnamed protein product [Eruca vesicaria subsp. sativa]
METKLIKYPATADPAKMATMQLLLQGVTGSQISVPITIVTCGIAKMFVGELVEIVGLAQQTSNVN